MFFSGLVLRIKIQKRWTSLTDYVDFCSVLHGLQIAEYSIINIFSSFGEKGQPSSSGYPTLNITGRVHFGGVEIHYI